MSVKFPEYKNLDLPKINREMVAEWKKNQSFEKSLELRKNSPSYVFYEGPPSANGIPGIHHVISRTIKDIVCRYKTLKGFRVDRRWLRVVPRPPGGFGFRYPPLQGW